MCITPSPACSFIFERIVSSEGCLPSVRAAQEMEGEFCKGEATTSFILTLVKEGTLVPFPRLTTSSSIKKCFYNIWEHEDRNEYDRAMACEYGYARSFERRNCQPTNCATRLWKS